MRQLLFDLFLLSLGAGVGISALCLVQAGSRFDREMEQFERRNEE